MRSAEPVSALTCKLPMKEVQEDAKNITWSNDGMESAV